MAHLSVAIIGLNRFGASVGLALKRHVRDVGRNTFDIVGHDYSQDNEKEALKMGAIDSIEHKLHAAVAGKDVIVISGRYEDTRDIYRVIAPELRDGVVILDAAPIKRPSMEWAKEFLTDEHHVIGITPIYNPKYLFQPVEDIHQAAADLFEDSSIVLTPSVSTVKAAVDLGFTFCSIIGSRPRFLDPVEHDMMLAYTDGLPKLVGMMLFRTLIQHPSWDDMKWFTNPNLGAIVRPLHDEHPDALRDEWLGNRDVLTRALDDMIGQLQQIRQALGQDDRPAVEAVTTSLAEVYEEWINSRFRADWDQKREPKLKMDNTLLGTMFGQGIMKRFSKDDDDDK